MKVSVIHKPERLDRCKHVAELHALFPSLILTYAQTPAWEQDSFNRAVRGCSLSHLLAARSLLTSEESVLVLEDDAVMQLKGWEAWKNLEDKIPPHAGVILLGAETERCGEADADGFREVFPPFWGSHAVLYLPSLLQSQFFTNAYAELASRPIGKPPGVCYESIVLLALQNTGLKVYRPPSLAFITAESFSDRDGTLMPARIKNSEL